MAMKCSIKYDNNSIGIYYIGQTVSGKINFESYKKNVIYALKLGISGFSKVEWKEGDILYQGREDYIHEYKYLLGSDVCLFERELPKNFANSYNFSFQLPTHIPTSTEIKQEFCFIRYKIIFEVQQTEKKTHWEFPLTIIKNVDLNAMAKVKTPFEVVDKKTFLFSSKALNLSAKIPITGFVSGQTANVQVSMNNETNERVKEIILDLVKIVQFSAMKPKMKIISDSKIITSEKVLENLERGSKIITLSLMIPPVTPSSDSSCHIIQTVYELHVTAKFGGIVSGLSKGLQLKIPIVIGTIPIVISMDKAIDFSMGESSSSLAAIAPTPSAPPVTASSTSDDYESAPPSYMEAMAVVVENVEGQTYTTNQHPFNPSYPVFNFKNYENYLE